MFYWVWTTQEQQGQYQPTMGLTRVVMSNPANLGRRHPRSLSHIRAPACTPLPQGGTQSQLQQTNRHHQSPAVGNMLLVIRGAGRLPPAQELRQCTSSCSMRSQGSCLSWILRP
jgi:hypothetical protein